MPQDEPTEGARRQQAAGNPGGIVHRLDTASIGASDAAPGRTFRTPEPPQRARPPVTGAPPRTETLAEPRSRTGAEISDAGVSGRGEARVGRWAVRLLFLGDVLAFAAAFFLGRIPHDVYYHKPLAHALLGWWSDTFSVDLTLFPLLASIAVVTFALRGHYAPRKGFWDELGEVIQALTVFTVLSAAFAFIGKWPLSRLWLFSTWTLAFLLVPLTRTLLRWLLRRVWGWSRPYVLIGTGDNAAEAVRAFASEPLLSYTLQAVLVPPGAAPPAAGFPCAAPVLSLGEDPLATLTRLGRPQAVLALEPEQWGLQQRLVRTLGLGYPRLTIAPTLRGLPLFGLESMHFFSRDMLMLRVRDNLNHPGSRLLKRVFDLGVAGTLTVLLAPVWLILAWRIHREDGGPVLFGQERVGHHGRPFICYKFRSMRRDAEAELGDYLRTHPDARAEFERNFKLHNDPRVTRVGRFLRRTSLDELPQLFNVLKGDMSLVGPRPLLANELDRYGEGILLFRQVRPGITGLWQTGGRSDTTFSDRAALDAWYVKNWSLWYDIVILLRTVKVLFRREGAY